MGIDYKRAHDAYVKTHGLPMTLQVVLYWICDAASDDTGEAWPGQDALAKLCGATERHIHNAVRKLSDLGILEITEEKPRRGKSQRYRILLEPIRGARANRSATQKSRNVIPESRNVIPPLDDESRNDILPTNDESRNVIPESRNVIPNDYKGTRARLEPAQEPVKENTKNIAREGDVKKVEAEAEATPTLGDPTIYCVTYSAAAPCPHMRDALAWLKGPLEYRPKPNESLHNFLHEHSLEDLKILYAWQMRTDSDKRHWYPGFVCGRNADHNLSIAKREHVTAEAKADSKRCHHGKDLILWTATDDRFFCKHCDATLTEAQAAERGVSRDDWKQEDVSSLLSELGKAFGVPF